MAQFERLQLTPQGQLLLSKVQTGELLEFSRVAVTDDGSVSIDLAILTPPVVESGKARLDVAFVNRLDTEFYLHRVEVYATDPDDGEILYAAANVIGLPDRVPPETSSSPQQRFFALFMWVDNASNVTAKIGDFELFTWEDFKREVPILIEAAIDDHNADPYANPAAINRHDTDPEAHDGRFTEVDERFAAHIGHGGTNQHPLADGVTAGFSEINYNAAEQARIDERAETNRTLALMRPRNENSNVITRTGVALGANLRTVTFPQPFPTVPIVLVPRFPTVVPTNITVNGFTMNGVGTGPVHWIAISDNSPPLIQS